jgi:predicted ATPase/class 3 adenylate cyclase/DNA-binding SARP family transcriptional activator
VARVSDDRPDHALPRGLVTFLFTDVAGSTSLWEDAPSQMGSAMARHDEVVEAEVQRHGGVVVRPRGEGDSRFAVFAKASDALPAAIEIQRQLLGESWRTPRPISVRMALHTGEADVREGDYYGRAVNRCARLRSLGHPGQILVSRTTRDLLLDHVQPPTELVDLGEHPLTDLARPEQVYQAVHPSLPRTFPPLRTQPGSDPSVLPLAVSLLGSFQVLVGDQPVELGSPGQRAFLAQLTLVANQDVTVDTLARGIWGDRQPKEVARAIGAYAAAVRAVIEPAGAPNTVLTRTSTGYRLHLPIEAIDAARFEHLAEQGRTDLTEGRADTAARRLAAALGLWRGDPLADPEFDVFAAAFRARLKEVHLGVVEDHVEAEIASGRHADVVAELRAHVLEHPRRERLWAALMVALYRSGSRTAALDCYAEAVESLAGEGAGAPGHSLSDLQRRIQSNDPLLSAPPGAARPTVKLPTPVYPLVGRSHELASLKHLFIDISHRLVTLTGPGGIGKTRLALEAAASMTDDFPGGVFFVPLAAARDGAAVLQSVAAVVEVRESADEALVTTLARSLNRSPTLLVLDNLEQAGDMASTLDVLLDGAAQLVVMATSRSPLRISNEQRFPVEPLPLPEPLDTLSAEGAMSMAAIRLFEARAQSVEPQFRVTDENVHAVVEVCHKVEGSPLAIELAAARSDVLSPAELAVRLSHQLEILTSGPADLPERHRTLRATIEWSFSLLSDVQRRALISLSVFANPFTLQDAASVLDESPDAMVSTLTTLVDSSLIRRLPAGAVSEYRLLDSVREYAAYGDGGASNTARARLVHHLVASIGARAGDLAGPDSQDALREIRRLYVEARASIPWAIEHGMSADVTQLLVALRVYWMTDGQLTEARGWVERVLEAEQVPSPVVAELHLTAGVLSYLQDDHDTAGSALEQSLLKVDPASDAGTYALATGYLGAVRLGEGDVVRAQECVDRTADVAERADHYESRVLALSLRAVMAAVAGDVPHERETYQERLGVARRRGDGRRVAESLNNLAEICLVEGDLDTGREFAEEALDRARGIGRIVTRDALYTLGRLELLGRRADSALAHAHEALRLCLDLGQQFEISQCVALVGAVAAENGDYRAAAALMGAGHSLRAGGAPLPVDLEPDITRSLATVKASLGDMKFAAAYDEGGALPQDRGVALALNYLPTR